jgi:hypothetical protein
MQPTNPTPEEMALICQCGSIEWVHAEPSRTAVSVVCARCGVRSAAKSFLKATGPTGERVVAPTGEDADTAPRAPSTKRRVTVPLEPEAHRIVQIALLVARIEHGADERFCGRSWMPAALEAIAADFLAGQDPGAVELATEQYDGAQPAAAEVC